jgi:uncharacterized protein
MKLILTVAGVAILAYSVILAGLYIFQRRLVYPVQTAPYHKVSELGLDDLRELKLQATDGTTLIAWWMPAEPGKSTLLYFHGNAAALLNRLPRIERFSAAGYGVFMPAYRGYSGSEGSPSEAALIDDAVMVYDALRERGVSEHNIVLYGESLGTGVAIQLAGRRKVAGIVLDAPYTSLPDVAQLAYPFMPVQSFMTERFDSRRHIQKLDVPVLMMHGTEDQVIPISFGRELFSAANAPKRFEAIEGAAHSNIYDFGAFAHLDKFLKDLSGASVDAGGVVPAR